MTVLKPLVHMNGSSAQSLAESHKGACAALRVAMTALEGAAPNARDYYPISSSAFGEAEKQYLDRVRALKDVLAQMIEIHEHICDEIEKRKR